MKTITFADVVHPSLSFIGDIPAHAAVLELIDTRWVQRLRDISQTANTRLVYMFSEHSRFGHSLGVAYLANVLMEKLSLRFESEIEPYRVAVSVAALLHDIGHLAPGSHTAFKTWFPEADDCHEEMAIRILNEDSEIQTVLKKHGANLKDDVIAILSEKNTVPPWCWEIISGGGWNVDRGNWLIADSILAGVSYGRYNIPALIDSIVITPDKHLALQENRLDAMMHFALSRHAMYRQVYQHRVLLSADTLNMALAKRARHLGSTLPFADAAMKEILDSSDPRSLSLETIFSSRESWWRYHLYHWAKSDDQILADIADRLLYRRLLKTIRVAEIEDTRKVLQEAKEAVREAGFDPDYYLHFITTSNVNVADFKKSMNVLMDDGRVRHLGDAEPLFGAMAKASGSSDKAWIVLPQEAKRLLGRER